MGITGLLPRISSILERTPLSSYKGKSVAIDLSMLTHQGFHGHADKLLNKSNMTNHGKFLESSKTDEDREKDEERRENYFIEVVSNQVVNRCLLIVQEGVELVAVLDGMTPPLKRGTTGKRRVEAGDAMERVDESASSSSSSWGNEFNTQKENYTLIRKAGGSADTKKKIHEVLLKKLRESSIPFIVAPYEADSQLAFLSNSWKSVDSGKGDGKFKKSRLADLIITDDSDAIPYAISSALFKLDSENYGQLYKRVDLPTLQPDPALQSNKNPLVFINFSNVMVTVFCIAQGCDYLGNLPQVGPMRAMEAVREAFLPYINGELTLDPENPDKNTPLRRLFDDLRKYMKHLDKRGRRKYELDFMRAVALFRHPTVYDPMAQGNVIMQVRSS